MRRLTNYEYNNTLNELLALNGDFSKNFPPDSFSADGFKNNGFYMGISALQIEYYIEAANQALDEAIFTGEQPEQKFVDFKTTTTITNPDEDLVLRITNPQKHGGLLAWKDFPREGPVVVEVAISGLDDPDYVFGNFILEIGQRARKKGNPRYSLQEASVDPEVSKQGDLVHLRYRIPKIEAFPIPHAERGFLELVLRLYDTSYKKGVQVQSMVAKGPYYETWPPKSHRQVFIPSDNADKEDVYAREILTHFMTRAWRRPVSGEEVDALHDAYLEHRKTDPFVEAIKKCLARVLIAPDFLYLVERKGPTAPSERLGSYELANRLSYFLWSNMPDDRLFKLAEAGELASPETLRAEVRRMLKDERSWDFVDQFTSQWLSLYRMDSIAVSPELYPEFDEAMKDNLKAQTQHFFAHVLRENLSALNFIDSDFTFLNERLDRHYAGRKGEGSTLFKKVTLPQDSDRGGLLAQGSIHLANSDGEDSHAIARGVWLVDRLLGDPPPSPPADIELDEDIEGFEQMSLKQQLAAHVEKESCARCHIKIDPFGIAFEHFDAIGVFRNKIKMVDEKELEKRVNAATEEDPEAEFKKIDTDNSGLLTEQEWFAHAQARNPEKQDENRLRKTFTKIARIEKEKETITLLEYIQYVQKRQQTALKKVYDNIPDRHIAVDASTRLPDSTEIEGLDGLQAYLLNHKKDAFAESMVRRLLTYALGRSLEFSDQPTVDQLTEQFKQNDYKLGTLVEDIVLCELFQTK